MIKGFKIISPIPIPKQLFWIVGFILLSTSCGEMPRDWESCFSQKCASLSNQSTSPSEYPNNELIIYVDTSLSMAGYVSPNGNNRFSAAPDGQTIYSKTLLELRSVVNTFSPQLSPIVKHVDVDDKPRTPAVNTVGLVYPATTRSLYTGKETNLVGAIKSFSIPLQENQENAQPPRFHILVTDGVQSTENQQAGSNCLKGSDAGCVKTEIQALLRKNWHGIILGLRSEFDGDVYSENAPRSLPPDKRKNSYPSGNQNAEKFRPFYLYIFSPDKAGLDKLVETLKHSLRARSDKMVIREYGLTTDYTKGNATVINPDLSDKAKNYLFVKDETQKTGDMPQFTVTVDADTAQLDTANALDKRFWLHIKPDWSSHAIDSNIADIARTLKWQIVNCLVNTETDDNRYPNLKIVTEEIKVSNDGTIEVPLEVSWLPNEVGTKKWRVYRLISRIDTEKTAPPWVNDWSAEDDQKIDTANKTLNLSISLANLWQNDAVKNQQVAEVCLRVGE